MFKKLRDKAKEKKGFTLVELIVVIVIILILAAVLVPNVLKYVDKSNKANVKSDGATILTQIQADVADAASENQAVPTKVTVGTVKANKVDAITIAAKGTKKTAEYIVDADGNVTNFAYRDTKHYVTWDGTWYLDGTAQ